MPDNIGGELSVEKAPHFAAAIPQLVLLSQRRRMPVYHSAYNTEQGSQTLGGVLPLLPLKDAARGPAPALSDATARDVVEEALYFFRSNCLFQSFKIDSSADLVMVYVTLFIHQCLKRLEAARPSHMADAQRLLTTLAITDLQQPVPGIAGWPLDGLVPAPADSGQSGACSLARYRNYSGGINGVSSRVHCQPPLPSALSERRSDKYSRFCRFVEIVPAAASGDHCPTPGGEGILGSRRRTRAR